MNENKNHNVQYFEDEVDIRELIMTLWKKKNTIIGLTLIFSILAGIFSMFILSPVYDTKLNIVISMPETFRTKYGEYTLPITSNEQYINLIKSNDVINNTIRELGFNSNDITLEKLSKRISINDVGTNTGNIQNSFEVTVSADNPEESLKIAEILFENYIEFMDVMTKERAVSFYYNYFNVDLKSLENSLSSVKESLKKNEELLAQTPKVISEGNANLEIQTQLTDTIDYVVPVDTINPNYIKVENDIVENKQAINSIENTMRLDNLHLKELEVEKQVIKKYYETGQIEKLESSVIGLVETSVYLPSQPVAPTQKTSPSNALNTIIGAIVGLMFSMTFVIIREFWFNKNS